MKKALVTGATGFVGSFLVEALLDRDRDVHCVVRRSSNLRWLKQLPVKFVTWDLVNDPPPREHLSDVNEVYHAAGVLSARSRDGFFRVNADGVEQLLDALHDANAPVERLVMISSLAAAGPARNRVPLTEDDPPDPVSNYGKSKREGERRLLRHANGYDYTIIRPPVIIGPRDEMVLDMVEMVDTGIVPKFGRYKTYSFIYVSDLVRGICRAMETDRARNEIYFLSHPEPVGWTEFLTEIGHALDRNPTVIPVPDHLATILATIGAYVDGIPGLKDSFTRDKALEMQQRAWLCSSKKARDHLNFQCSVDFENTIRNTIDWYRQNGWIR